MMLKVTYLNLTCGLIAQAKKSHDLWSCSHVDRTIRPKHPLARIVTQIKQTLTANPTINFSRLPSLPQPPPPSKSKPVASVPPQRRRPSQPVSYLRRHGVSLPLLVPVSCTRARCLEAFLCRNQSLCFLALVRRFRRVACDLASFLMWLENGIGLEAKSKIRAYWRSSADQIIHRQC